MVHYMLLSIMYLWFVHLTPEPSTLELMRRLQPREDVISNQMLLSYADTVDRTAYEFGVDRKVLIISAYNESVFRPDITNVMQISSPWSQGLAGPSYCKEARRDPHASFRCGGYIYSLCQKKFKGDNVLVCWAGFHIDRKAYLEEFERRWRILI